MKVFNTLTKRKEQFIPITQNTIKMYVCGQTVYDYCHLGHARKAVVFDMIRRWFIACSFRVIYVENITDIDDKIIARASENNETISELTERFIGYMHEDFAQLGVLRPDREPKATEYMPQMLEIIQSLIDQGYAYVAANGDVYYRIHKFADYGKLSGKSVKDLRAGERVEIDVDKEDPLDFVLWKSAKEGEPYWDSSFGRGRPGWHIECSAMAADILGAPFDIHGGGQDLQFPHHENEIAQSEAHHGCTLANYWLHNGFLNINDEKMSKSLGNFSTLRDVLKLYDAEVIRFFMLRTHYRSPLNFAHESLIDSKNALQRIYQALKNCVIDKNFIIDWDNPYAKRYKAAMDDDFNTPLALSILFEMVTQLNRNPDNDLANRLIKLAGCIGLLQQKAEQFLCAGATLAADYVKQQIELRAQARKDKNFQLSDQIRDELLAQGIVLEDSSGETIWRKL